MRVDELTIMYGHRIAVERLSLDLKQGEIVTIIGPNGAGKSSLLRGVNGGLQPGGGRVLLEGLRLSSYTRQAIAQRIAVVAQEAELRFPVTVLEFVLGGRYAWASTTGWGWETEHDLRVVRDVLHETELNSLARRLMNELSGGERQRCLLARALATEASILLLDEPTANMDLAHQARILSLIRIRSNKQNTAAIVITHDLNLAAHFSDRVLLMKDGRTVALGEPARVLTVKLLKEVFEVEVMIDAHPITGVPRVTSVHGT